MINQNFTTKAATAVSAYRAGGFTLDGENVRFHLLIASILDPDDKRAILTYGQIEPLSLADIEKEGNQYADGFSSIEDIYSITTDRNSRGFVVSDALRQLQRIEQNLIGDVDALEVDYDKPLDIKALEERIAQACKSTSEHTQPEHRGIPLVWSPTFIPIIGAYKIA